jgi:hypothetical protein
MANPNATLLDSVKNRSTSRRKCQCDNCGMYKSLDERCPRVETAKCAKEEPVIVKSFPKKHKK